MKVVNRLPASHKAVFEYLIEFMVELLKYSDKNRLHYNILGRLHCIDENDWLVRFADKYCLSSRLSGIMLDFSLPHSPMLPLSLALTLSLSRLLCFCFPHSVFISLLSSRSVSPVQVTCLALSSYGQMYQASALRRIESSRLCSSETS